MLESRDEHVFLLVSSLICCVLGTVGLTAGLFMSYSPQYGNMALGTAGGGAIMFLVGILIGKYTKWRSER